MHEAFCKMLADMLAFTESAFLTIVIAETDSAGDVLIPTKGSRAFEPNAWPISISHRQQLVVES